MTGIVSTVLIFLLIWGASVRRSGALIRISVLAVFAGGLLIIVTPLGSMVAERLTQIFELSDLSTLDRLFRAATGFMVFLENPLFGVGPGGYAFLYPRLGGIQFNIMATPLNVWLSFLTDVGIPGFLCLCWFLWGLLRRSFRHIRTDSLVAVYFWSSVSYLVLLTSSDNWFTEMFWFELAMLLVTSQGVLALKVEKR
jgi:O-antigen ligase